MEVEGNYIDDRGITLKRVQWESRYPVEAESELGATRKVQLIVGEEVFCVGKLKVTQIDWKDGVYTFTADAVGPNF